MKGIGHILKVTGHSDFACTDGRRAWLWRYWPARTELVASVYHRGLPWVLVRDLLFQSNTVGRGRTGSKHFTGLLNADVAGGNIAVGLYTKIGDTAQKSVANIAGTDPSLTWQARIWSNAHPTERSKVVSQYTNPNVRIMRRRTLHVGI